MALVVDLLTENRNRQEKDLAHIYSGKMAFFHLLMLSFALKY